MRSSVLASTLHEEHRQIGAAALELEVHVVRCLPATASNQSRLRVPLECEPFLELLRGVRPKILYLDFQEFDAKTNALAQLSSDDWDESLVSSVASDPRFKALVKRWCCRDGAMAWFAAVFVVDGVLHGLTRSEDWFEEFQGEAVELGETIDAERGAAAVQEDAQKLAERQQEVRTRAATLRVDPLFSARKISAEKRHYLATRLFPDLDRQTISAIVDEAINAEWFELGRRAESTSEPDARLSPSDD